MEISFYGKGKKRKDFKVRHIDSTKTVIKTLFSSMH